MSKPFGAQMGADHTMEHWIDSAVFYHIYPLGFCGCPEYNPGGIPVHSLDKLRDWIPHLRELGVNALYLGPVFQSVKHGYDTIDYYQIDCRLGDNDSFAALCDALHENGIRVVLDGVFNHVGREFWAFRDVREKGQSSPYCGWFQNLNFGGGSPMGDPFWYESWGGHYELVKLDLKNPQVRDHLLWAVGMWMDRFHIDGLRLDAADCVDFDFFRALKHYVRSRDPEFWLMGEIIHGDYARWANPEMLDSVTNYECWKGNWSAHNTKNYFEIAHSLHRQFGPGGIYRGLRLYNFTENHDVDRLASTLTDPALLENVYTLLYTMPGVPSIYYGGEWAVEGKRTPWSDVVLRPCLDLADMAKRDQSLCRHLAALARIRRSFPALAVGDYENLVIKNEQLVFRRSTPEQRVYVLLNLSHQEAGVEFRHNEPVLQDVLGGDAIYHNDGGRTWIVMPPCSAKILVGAPDRFAWSPSEPEALNVPAEPPAEPQVPAAPGAETAEVKAEPPAPQPEPVPQPEPEQPESGADAGQVLVLLAHPNGDSLNAAMAHAAADALRANGYGVWLHDLCAEGFDPVMPACEAAGSPSADPLVLRYQEELRQADGIVVVHPNWWGQPPAILTGWLDRVLREDVAYALPKNGEAPAPLLKARAALVFNTSNTPAPVEDAAYGDPLQSIWQRCVFGLLGLPAFDRCLFRPVAGSTPEQRAQWLGEVATMVSAYFPKKR